MRSTLTLALAALVISLPAMAQTNDAPRTTTTPAAVANPKDTNKTTAAPVSGKNSFTQAQIVSRLEKDGYTAVTNVKHDEASGVWHATATKGGAARSVDVDYQGNITAK